MTVQNIHTLKCLNPSENLTKSQLKTFNILSRSMSKETKNNNKQHQQQQNHNHHSQNAIDAKQNISKNLVPLLAVDYYEPPVRTVSSPSLTTITNQAPSAETSSTMHMQAKINNEENEDLVIKSTNNVELRTNSNNHSNNNNNNNNTYNNNGSISGNGNKSRFGGLIWRTSNERRKCHRRDKCNSGDSGIQIELENDEKTLRISRILPTHLNSPLRAHVRRTQSVHYNNNNNNNSKNAKVNSYTDNNQRYEKQSDIVATTPKRSISQPNGLEAYDILDSYDVKDSEDSDSVASHEDTSTTKTTIQLNSNNNNSKLYAEVLYNFTAVGEQELNLECGTIVEILRRENGPWWLGRLLTADESNISIPLKLLPESTIGWFPKEFVRILPTTITTTITKNSNKPTTTTTTTTINDATNMTMQKLSNNTNNNNITRIVIDDEKPHENQHQLHVRQNSLTNCLSINHKYNADLLRRSAVRELLDTEINYVKLLAAICEGYLPAMSKRVDIFSPNSVRLIFSNILAIYKFQRQFLEELHKGIETNQIAKVFLKMHKGFLCYSTYCNAYPRAILELETYDHVKDAKTILNNCRESENLAELPLSAHLLSPVQRICRYPLHLNEILKAFMGQQLPPTPHEQKVAEAENKVEEEKEVEEEEEDQEQNKNILLTESLLERLEQKDINEIDLPDVKETLEKALGTMKSITEAVNEGKRHSETIARHQSSFQNFKGPPLHVHSTRFFLQIDATRLKHNLWNSSYTLFLFDNQLIYCKRDIIKRSHFVYKGRLFLDRCHIVNVRDGKMFGHAVRNSLRIYCEIRHQWYDFSFRSSNRKQRFLNTLALERQFAEKILQVSEMTDFEWMCTGRDICHSDQSDCETSAQKEPLGAYASTFYQAINHVGGASATSGESSGPDSPAKSTGATAHKTNVAANLLKFSETLPKKKSTHTTRYDYSVNGENCGHEPHTGSLRRRRLGNWFRKSKSTSNTPNQSPTHEAAIQPIVSLK